MRLVRRGAVSRAVLAFAVVLGWPAAGSGQAFNVHYDALFHAASRLHVWGFRADALLGVTVTRGSTAYCTLSNQPHLPTGSAIPLTGSCMSGLVQAGDVVTVTDGTSTKTHVVTAVRVVSADYDGDVVSGTAEPGSVVTVVNHQGYLPTLVVTADAGGQWRADFGAEQSFDLSPCHGGEAVQGDSDGDSTQFSWFPMNWCGILDVARVYDGWVQDGSLVGPGTRRAFRRYLELAEGFRRGGDPSMACLFLKLAYDRCDASPDPPDFVVGGAPPELDATEELSGLIRMLIEINLRCG